MRPRRLLVCAGAALTLALPATPGASPGQEVGDELRALAEENAVLYARPLTSGLGAALNSGWYQGADVGEPLEFSLDLRLMGAFVPWRHERFTPRLPEELTVSVGGESRTYRDPFGPAADATTPSVAGTGDGAVFLPRGQLRDDLEAAGEAPVEHALRFPRGFDLPAIPMVTPQASVGLVLGTEVSARWLPSTEVTDEIGPVRSVGIGARHSLSRWIPGSFPLDVAVSAGLQEVEVGDYLSARARTVQLTVSESLSILTLYVSGGLEDSEVDIRYTLENPGLPEQGRAVSFTVDGDDTRRLTAGLSLDVLFLELAADYSVSRYDVVHVSAGLGI